MRRAEVESMRREAMGRALLMIADLNMVKCVCGGVAMGLGLGKRIYE